MIILIIHRNCSRRTDIRRVVAQIQVKSQAVVNLIAHLARRAGLLKLAVDSLSLNIRPACFKAPVQVSG